MHADKMEDIESIGAGEICALFGLECATGDTFTGDGSNIALESMFVPEPVISLSIKPKNTTDQEAFSKAINRFQRQDPTFKVHIDPETKETIVSGMGELHLEIYKERMLREYNCPTITGMPKVAYRETLAAPIKFDYIHKKQSGGAGQYGRVTGTIEPLSGEDSNKVEFLDHTVGQNIPKNFIPSIEKGFREACQKGNLTGSPIQGLRFILEDGASHPVDSNDLAFSLAAIGAVRQAFDKGNSVILQPIMTVEVNVPDEYLGAVIGGINKRKGTVLDSEAKDGYTTINCEISLSDMFGYSTELRAHTQGKGEFTLEFARYETVLPNVQRELIDAYRKETSKKK